MWAFCRGKRAAWTTISCRKMWYAYFATFQERLIIFATSYMRDYFHFCRILCTWSGIILLHLSRVWILLQMTCHNSSRVIKSISLIISYTSKDLICKMSENGEARSRNMLSALLLSLIQLAPNTLPICIHLLPGLFWYISFSSRNGLGTYTF